MTAGKARAGRTRRLTKEALLKREKAIISDIKAGVLSYRKIAQKHKVSLPTVNNKARKAGISRGRRKGARMVVLGPRRRKSTTRTTAKKTARKTTARTGTTTRKRVARPAAPRRRVARPAARSRRGKAGFSEAFRDLIMHHYPNISLKQFDKLSKMVEREIG